MRRLAALVFLLLAAAAPVRADDAADTLRGFYVSIEEGVHREYGGLIDAIERGETGGPSAGSETTRAMLKMLYYNKAVLFASCAAEAEQSHASAAARVPAENNLELTTCVEVRFGELNKFSNLVGYAGMFFPERIERCGEASRLRNKEKALAPYAFLELAEPKLYDFTRYNACLMKQP
jgi:hypothetical protein